MTLRRMLMTIAFLTAVFVLSCQPAGDGGDKPEVLSDEEFPRPVEYMTRNIYICEKIKDSPVIDGRINEEEWEGSEWTEDFVDITLCGLKPK